MMFGPGGQGGPPQGDDEMMEPGGGPGEDSQDRDISLNMLSRLGLSDEQIDRLCAEAYEPQVKSNQLKAELANLRFKMNCLKRKTNANPNEVKELYKKKGEIEGELFLIRQQSRAILESILTDEQKQRLNQRGPGRMNRNKP
jgi:Spy/CpxP family protein refolding chaperone